MHETKNGLKATVAQLKCHSGAAWIFSGAITFPNGETHMHHWSINGASLTGDARLDIAASPFSQAPRPPAPRADVIPFPVRLQHSQVMVG